MWFENWDSIYEILTKGVVCFVGLIVLLRVAGKRTLTKMNAFDFIVTLTIGSTLSATIISDSVTIAQGLSALAVIIAAQYAVSWLEVRSEWFQKLVKSKPSLLFYEGDFQEKVMRKERLTKVEVMAAIRFSGHADPSQVRAVLIETDGQLSVISKSDKTDKFGVLDTFESMHPQKEH